MAADYRAQQIIVQKFTWTGTIGITRKGEIFLEISFPVKLLQKAPKTQEFYQNLLALFLHNYTQCTVNYKRNNCYKQNFTSTSPESDFLKALAMTSASSDKA